MPVRALDRRSFVKLAAAAGLALGVPPRLLAQHPPMPKRRIPSTGEEIPIVGLGTSDEIEGTPQEDVARVKSVFETLVEHGGSVIDTAPGYGDGERVLGEYLRELGLMDQVFMSTKVKQTGAEAGMRSLERSQSLLGKQPLDLIMVHSLEDTDTQLDNLQRFKDAGRVRYIGVTTYRQMGYDVVEGFIRAGRVDFIQVDYSVVAPLAEERLIPVAADLGVAVMINSPFGNGAYFRQLRGQALPEWAVELGCESWAQFSLKYILSNPDVTCVIPATSEPEHMADNARAAFGTLPDAATRRRMVEHLRHLS